ncbi:MAG: MiaB/RimO family radical SAM methylthiotransferase, partial [Desulfobacterales bacterium]
MTTFCVTTLGCKVNHYESEAIIAALRSAGWTLAGGVSPVDIHIINTCTVTGKASMQSRQAIRQAARRHPAARVIVTGCYAQTAPHEIREIPGIQAVVGTSDKHRIPEMLLSAAGLAPGGAREMADTRKLKDIGDTGITVTGSRTRPFLKIQDGCDAFCTYCIVPYARGRSRSMAPEAVVAHVQRLQAAGHQEVVLTGIHLGLYGRDLAPPLDLASLVRRLLAATGIARIRLSSIEPGEISAALVEMAATSGRLCPHFHIPLQSGDDRILGRMHRPYSRKGFRELVLAIRDRMPDAAIGARSSVWPCAVLRGDEGEIHIGAESSVQDGSVLHTTPDIPTLVGDRCVIGHIVHLEACHIHDDVLIGNGSIVLHQVEVESWAIVAA